MMTSRLPATARAASTKLSSAVRPDPACVAKPEISEWQQAAS